MSKNKLTPQNFEEFASFLSTKIPFEECPIDMAEVTESMLSYFPEFLDLKAGNTKQTIITIPLHIALAIKCSIENSLLNKKININPTFMSLDLAPQEKPLLEALLLLQAQEHINAMNPLVSLLGYDTIPELSKIKWGGILHGGSIPIQCKTKFVSKPIHTGYLLQPSDISGARINLAMYHPFIWKTILEGRFLELKGFLLHDKSKVLINSIINTIPNKQKYIKQYFLNNKKCNPTKSTPEL